MGDDSISGSPNSVEPKTLSTTAKWNRIRKRLEDGEKPGAIALDFEMREATIRRKQAAKGWWPWKAIRESIGMGMPMAEAARTYGPSLTLVAHRARREDWASPSKFITEAAAAVKDSQTAVAEVLTQADDNCNSVALPEVDTDGAINQVTKAYEEWLARTAMKKVQIGMASIGVPKNWKDLKTADDLIRRALGLGKEGSKVTTLVRVGFGGLGEPVVDVGTVVDVSPEDGTEEPDEA